MAGQKASSILKKWRKTLPDWAVITVTIIIALAIALVLGTLVLGGILGIGGAGQDNETKAFSGPSWSYIAKIKVVGEIGSAGSGYYSSDQVYHHKWTLETIDTLIEDENNAGIYLWLNTPGGGVYESDELYLKLMEYKEKTGRPIYTYMTVMAASGGYYVAAASDEIYANRNTWTGSIGVTLGTLFDVSGFLEKHEIKTDTITSGDNKSMGNYYQPLTDEQRKIYQSLVDESYEQFVGIVAEGRGLTLEDAKAISDGRIYTAKQALDVGLIDAIMGEEEAEEAIKAKFEGAGVYYCYYRPDTQFSLFSSGSIDIWDLLGIKSKEYKSSEFSGDVAAVLELVNELEDEGMPQPKYLYTG